MRGPQSRAELLDRHETGEADGRRRRGAGKQKDIGTQEKQQQRCHGRAQASGALTACPAFPA